MIRELRILPTINRGINPPLIYAHMQAGRKYMYKTPEELRAAIDDFFLWCDNTPVKTGYDVRAKGDSKKPDKMERKDEYGVHPYTLYELAWKLGVCDWRHFKRDNYDREGFAEVFDYAENRVTGQQVIGGLLGMYNANLTARLNGIAENIVTDTMPAPQILADEDE